jgi:hypothetical protein
VVTTTAVTELGNYSALVLPDKDLDEDLVSTNPFLEAGFNLTMTAQGGKLWHPETGEEVGVRRDGPCWMVDLEDIARLKTPRIREKLEKKLSVGAFKANAVRAKESPVSLRDRVLRLHERMGHAGMEAMCKACTKDGAWTHAGITATQIRRVMRSGACIVCWLAKRNKRPIPKASGDRRDSTSPGEIISADIIGKISPSTTGGDCWYFEFVDAATGYEHVYTSASKDGFVQALELVVEWYRSMGREVRILRTDSERVLTMGAVATYLSNQGIKSEQSVPYAHYQNLVERYVQTTSKGVSALLHGQRFLKAEHWDKALFHYIDCRNRTPNSKCGNRSPHQVLTGEQTNVEKQFQFAFGDLVSVRIPDSNREWKFDLRHDIGIFVGQPYNSVDAGQVYFPYTGEVSVRTDLALLDIDEEAYSRYYSRRQEVRNNTHSV